MKHLHIDFETYSDADLKTVGAYKYAQDPTTRVLLMAYSYDDEVMVVDLENGESIPQQVLDDLVDPSVQKWAHNASFERVILENVLKIPARPEEWKCTMVWALSLSLPASLSELGTIVGLESEEAKIKEGKSLIREFCTLKGKKNADKWEDFKEYCKRDVIAEKKIVSRLSKYPMPESEWKLWQVDQKINDTGLPIDVELVNAIVELSDDYRKIVTEKVIQSTGIQNPNSVQQLSKWMEEKGVKTSSLDKEAVSSLLKDWSTPDEVREVLKNRQQLSKSSIAKYTSLSRATGNGDRLRGAFQFAGASRTGRWAGRIFQPQNLPRPLIDDEEIGKVRNLIRIANVESLSAQYEDFAGVMSSCIRSMIIAPKGKQLVVADFASIESIMIAWCAQSEHLLKLFHEGLDPYKDFATKVYGVEYEEVTKEMRTLCKPAVLGAGYGLSGKGLLRYADSFGLNLSLYEATKQINIFRKSYGDIPSFWSSIDKAMKMAMLHKGDTVEAGRFSFLFDGMFLHLIMPSGRSLHYYKPRFEDNAFGRTALHYESEKLNIRTSTHPGKIVENIVQAISRDLLGEALVRLDNAGFEIIGHVHDEILCLADKDDDRILSKLITTMTQNPIWCLDAPIKASGYSNAEYYKKD